MLQEVPPHPWWKTPQISFGPSAFSSARLQSLCLELLVLGLGVREPNFFLWGGGVGGRAEKKNHCYWDLSKTWLELQQRRRWERVTLQRALSWWNQERPVRCFFPTLGCQQTNDMWSFLPTCWAEPWSIWRPPLGPPWHNFWSIKMTFIITGLGEFSTSSRQGFAWKLSKGIAMQYTGFS